jgi:Protein of unknown function (DUF3572)
MKRRCNFGKSWHLVATMPVNPRLQSQSHAANHISILSQADLSTIAHRSGLHMKSKTPARVPSPSSSPLTGNRRTSAERRDAAAGLAIAALGFVAGTPEELSRFLALTGIAPDAIRAAAAEPGFLGGVLAYIAGNERTLVAFASHAGVAPEEVEQARIVLAGADWEREVP